MLWSHVYAFKLFLRCPIVHVGALWCAIKFCQSRCRSAQSLHNGDPILKIQAQWSHLSAQYMPAESIYSHYAAALKHLALLYAENEDALDLLVPPSRRDNNNLYARSVKALVRKSKCVRCFFPSVVKCVVGCSVAWTGSRM